MKRLFPYRSRLPAILFTVTAVLAGCLLVPPSSAHPPSGMSITYHELTKELSVSITHAVPNPGEHYVKEVTVSLNGKVVNASRYTSQPTQDTFTYTYPVETVTTDEIKVTATCSLAGSISRTLYNTGPVASAPPPDAGPPATKASSGLCSLIGVGVAVFLARKH